LGKDIELFTNFAINRFRKNMIIAREKQIETLQEAMRSDRSEFIAIYGRRRVGKTFLVNEALDGKFAFRHAGIYGEDKTSQIDAFCASARDAGIEETGRPRNWLQAFEILKQVVRESKSRKKVLFLDELSWMYTPKCDLISALESFWNGWASARKDVVLIVCASATSWMVNRIIHNKGGLYNRLTAQIWLQPFCLAECEMYVKARQLPMSRDQILEMYMIGGGVPYYWSLLRRELSLPLNIDSIFFAPDAPLANEFEYLYSSLFTRPEPYIRAIDILGHNKEGMSFSEIQQEIGLELGGSLTTVLKDLESCGFIRSFRSFGKKKNGTMFQLIDSFSLFHFKFLADKSTDTHYWSHKYNSPGVNSWRGLAFERVCLWHIPQIKQALGISGIHTEYSSWKCKTDEEKGVNGAQIDLVIDRADKMITICEMKYHDKVYAMTKRDYESLRSKIESFRTVTKTRKGISLAMVTANGISRSAYSSNVDISITYEDLFYLPKD